MFCERLLVITAWYLLSEPSKWVSVSRQRFSGVATDASTATAWIKGAADEDVTVAWMAPGTTGAPGVLQRTCKIGASGEVAMHVSWTNARSGAAAAAPVESRESGWNVVCEKA